MDVRPVLDLNPNAGSVRLVFVRDSQLSRVWHIADVAISKEAGQRVLYMALHGDWVYPGVQADTMLQAELQTMPGFTFCARCLEEYKLAEDVIKEKGMVRFR